MIATGLSNLVACPVCKTPLALLDGATQTMCVGCKANYRCSAGLWDFTPPVDAASALWQTWTQLQENGVTSYTADPEHNLSVGDRPDCQQFAQFCGFQGLVLDVGCGPQAWPAYFDAERPAQYFGIDPLPESEPARFSRVRGLAEYLPFQDQVFDHVVFSTTLDHFVDPLTALKEARRICQLTGEIDIWLGEKRVDAPRLLTSPTWYQELHRPQLAEDFFHIKRLNVDTLASLIEAAHLKLVDHQQYALDPFRTNHFYRAIAEASEMPTRAK